MHMHTKNKVSMLRRSTVRARTRDTQTYTHRRDRMHYQAAYHGW